MKTLCLLYSFLIVFLPVLHSQNAPVITAGQVTDADPSDPSTPVSVTGTGFTSIGQFTLTLKFDTLQLQFVSAVTNPSLPGMSAVYTPPSGNTQGKLVFQWTGASNTSLEDGSSIVDLNFHYSGGTGTLNWAYTFGSVCQFKRYSGGTLTALNDTPKYLYYINGGISNRTAPVVIAPVVPFPQPGPLTVAITVRDFYSISAFTLYLEYDPTIITFMNTFTFNSVFEPEFQLGDNPGSDGKRLIIIEWFGDTLNLNDDDTICAINFNYQSATCTPCVLTWTDNGPSCEFMDESGFILLDLPRELHYTDGIVASGILSTWTGNAGNAWNDTGNWNNCGIPDATRDVVIPDVSPLSFPVITSTGYCKSIRIESGATVTVGSSGSIIVGNQ